MADASHAFAAGTAVARAFPLFNTKAAHGGGPGMGGKGNKVNDYADGTLQLGKGSGKPRTVPVYMVPHPRSGEHIDHKKAAMTEHALREVALGVQLAARMVDAPTNYMHTDACVEEAAAVFEQAKASCDGHFQMTVIRGEELKQHGLGLIWGVGKAAVHKPALCVLSHAPDNGKGDITGGIALCGKGIVYDTGGLSIKGKTFMPGMKRDMGGAATCLAAWQAIVRCKTKNTVHAVLCLAENAVGPESTRPDDIHSAFSGKTVEIANTDAEGRLVLGDGVSYAAQILQADTIIDAATLTGAQGIATGKRHAAVYCSTEYGETVSMAAGRFSGDLTFPVPYAPEMHRHEFRSACADMTNNVKDRSNAQVSCAGQFIGNHLPEGWTDREGNCWIHIDFAYCAFEKSSERATGYGVALLATLCGVMEKAGCRGVVRRSGERRGGY